jgi:glycosyltransferase involved in cell wall biosynthesis
MDEFDIEIFYLEDYKQCRLDKEKSIYIYPDGTPAQSIFNHAEYDGIFFFYHRAHMSSVLKMTTIPPEKTAICINNEKWVLDGPQYTFEKYFKHAKIITGSNSYITKIFSKLRSGVMPLSQCVDPSIFYPQKRIKGKFTIGWSGNPSNPFKNVNWLKTACRELNIPLSISQDMNQNELNDWYSNIDVLVCCSLDHQEGGPNCILEAGACKVPVLTTQVGLVRDLVVNRMNGLITPHRRLDRLMSNILKMRSKDMRAELAEHLYSDVIRDWTYEKRLDQIRSVLQELVQ